MEVIPQNTANKVFSDPQYQTWEYQKPYLLELGEKSLILLDNNLWMSGLKTDNTLYDTDRRQVSFIDAGGIIKFRSKEDRHHFDPSLNPQFQCTRKFATRNGKKVIPIQHRKSDCHSFGYTMYMAT